MEQNRFLNFTLIYTENISFPVNLAACEDYDPQRPFVISRLHKLPYLSVKLFACICILYQLITEQRICAFTFL